MKLDIINSRRRVWKYCESQPNKGQPIQTPKKVKDDIFEDAAEEICKCMDKNKVAHNEINTESTLHIKPT